MQDLKNNTSIIINHYNSFDFFELIKKFKNYHLYVYDKTKKLNTLNIKNFFDEKIIPSDNIGREGNIYLKHIIENYKNLSEYNIFIQDDTNQHIPNIDAFCNQTNKVIEEQQKIFMYPVWWRNTGEYSKQIHLRRYNNGLFSNTPSDINDCANYLKEKLNIRVANHYVTETCSFFIVNKKIIYKRPLEWYIELKKEILENNMGEFALELLWKAIFSSI